jgi:hypothetical protein
MIKMLGEVPGGIVGRSVAAVRIVASGIWLHSATMKAESPANFIVYFLSLFLKRAN